MVDTKLFSAYMAEPTNAVGLAGPQNYGATGDGVANDSAAFTAAIAARRNVLDASGKSYAIKDVALSHSQSIIGNDAIFLALSGATNLVTLNGFGARIANMYISDSTACSAAAIRVSGASRVCRVESVTLINTGYGALKLDPATGSASRGVVEGLYAESVTNYGVEIAPSASDWRFSDFFIDGKVNYDGGGLGKPTVGMIGWRQNTTPAGGLAVGGHQLSNGSLLDCDTGMWLTDAQLTKVSNVNLDSCSGYGLRVDGDSYKIDIADLFCGFTAGIYYGGTTSENFIDGLRTENTGVVPTWGQTGFYTVSAPFYDLQVRDTASVLIRNWKGSKKIAVDATAKLIVVDGETFQGKSVGTVAAGATTYLGVQGQSTTEGDVRWRVPYDCYLIRIQAATDAAPGVGETFTYTARYNAADTALVATISGAADFGGVDVWAGSLIPMAKGGTLSLKLVTSASAAAGRQSCILQLAPR